MQYKISRRVIEGEFHVFIRVRDAHKETKHILFFFTDGLEDKLLRVPLANYFPDYSGDSYNAACKHILYRFMSVNRSSAKAGVYPHYTRKTDTQQVKCEFFILHVDNTSDDTGPSHAERHTRDIITG